MIRLARDIYQGCPTWAEKRGTGSVAQRQSKSVRSIGTPGFESRRSHHE